MPTVKLTPAAIAALERRPGVVVRPAAPVPRARGRAQRHTPGAMNKTEARYRDEVLEPARLAGGVLQYWFEATKFRLAKATYYQPDFMVMQADGLLEFHEVKGHWEDDARVKWKTAAEQYWPFKFVAVTRHKSGWKFEVYE